MKEKKAYFFNLVHLSTHMELMQYLYSLKMNFYCACKLCNERHIVLFESDRCDKHSKKTWITDM